MLSKSEIRAFLESQGWRVTRFDVDDTLDVWCLDPDGEGRVLSLSCVEGRFRVSEIDRDRLTTQNERHAYQTMTHSDALMALRLIVL